MILHLNNSLCLVTSFLSRGNKKYSCISSLLYFFFNPSNLNYHLQIATLFTSYSLQDHDNEIVNTPITMGVTINFHNLINFNNGVVVNITSQQMGNTISYSSCMEKQSHHCSQTSAVKRYTLLLTGKCLSFQHYNDVT